MIGIPEYLSVVKKELTDILFSQRESKTKNEKSIQSFLELHPTALMSVLDDVEANYSIYGGLVISQPRFKSLETDRKPDFLIVTSNSLNLYFNFIELEDPSKKIFNLNGQKPTTDFSEAYNQLMQWNSYNDDEVENYCRYLLDNLFKDNYDSRTHKTHHYNFVLVYGFSDEIIIHGSRHNHLLQKYFNDKNLHLCTYSRIVSKVNYKRKLICVKQDVTSKFKAIGMTPFQQYKNDEWSDYRNVQGKDEAIRSNIFLSDLEKEELIQNIQIIDKKTFRQITDE